MKKVIKDDSEDDEYEQEEPSQMEEDIEEEEELTTSQSSSNNLGSSSNDVEAADDDDENAYVMGIDEAGRGPVVGPLVYACMFCKSKYNTDNFLKKTFNVNDSKKLTAKMREKIFKSLKENSKIVHYITCIVQSDEISHKMLSRKKYNLNLISHDCAIHLIKTASETLSKKGKYLKEVYIDTVGDPKKYQAKLQEKFPEIESIVVDKKADSKYPVVGGASIVAKVKRDEMVEEIQALKYSKLKMGSGYTSDKFTKDFLNKALDKVFGYHHTDVRFSWSTIKKLLDDNASTVEWEDDGVDDGTTEDEFESPFETKQQTKLSFHISAAEKQRHRIDFMANRNIELVSEF